MSQLADLQAPQSPGRPRGGSPVDPKALPDLTLMRGPQMNRDPLHRKPACSPLPMGRSLPIGQPIPFLHLGLGKIITMPPKGTNS